MTAAAPQPLITGGTIRGQIKQFLMDEELMEHKEGLQGLILSS